jgi:hypothetical protein
VDLSKYKPDKATTYKYPIEEEGWTHAHNSLRGQIDTFGEALWATVERSKGKPPSAWEVAAIQLWWKSHFKVIHCHHHNEDKRYVVVPSSLSWNVVVPYVSGSCSSCILHAFRYVPFFQKRFKYPPKLEADHVTLCELLDKLASLIAGLSTEDVEGLGKLAKAWDEYGTMLKPHLVEEEAFVLPLMRAYFTHKEMGKLVEAILSDPKAPPEEIGAFIHFMGEEKFRSVFMKQEGIPFFVWWVGGFGSKLTHYRAEVVPLVDALKSGTASPPSPRSCRCM